MLIALILKSYCAGVEDNRAIIVSDIISGSVLNVKHNKFENHKISTFKHFLPSGVWAVRHMISDFYISVVVTLIT